MTVPSLQHSADVHMLASAGFRSGLCWRLPTRPAALNISWSVWEAALSFPPHAPQKICWRWKDAAVVCFCREATRCSTWRGKQEAAVWLWRFSCREEAGGTEPNCKNTSVISVQGHTGCFCFNIMYKAVFCPRLSRDAVKHWRVQLTDIRRPSINTGSCSWRLNVLQTSSQLYINLLVPTWITPCTFTCTLMNWSLSDLWIYQIIQVVMKTA